MNKLATLRNLLMVQVLFQGFNILAREDIICSSSNEPELKLNCDRGEVIDIIATKVGYVDHHTQCGEIKDRIGAAQEISQCFEDIPFGLCHGERFCTIYRDDIATTWYPDCEDNYYPDTYYPDYFLYVNYSCHTLNNPITLPTRDGIEHQGRVIDLFSRRNLPNQFMFLCKIERQRDFNVRLVVKLARLYSLMHDCNDSLNLTDAFGRQFVYDVCSNHLEAINNYELLSLYLYCPFKISFTKKSWSSGIKFWIQFSADESFHLQCKRQRPGTEEFHINTDDCIPDEIVHKSGSIIPGVIGGLVGFVFLMILVVLFVVYFRKRRSQKESSQLPVTPSAPSEENIYYLSGAASNQPVNTDLEPSRSHNTNIYYNAAACVSHENEYTAVHEPKKPKINHDTDEIIMSENDELYLSKDSVEEIRSNGDVVTVKEEGKNSATPDNSMDTEKQEESDGEYTKLGPRENPANIDNTQYQMLPRKISEDKDSNDNDSVIMYENNELYCSSVDLTRDEEDRGLENEFNLNLQLDDDDSIERIKRNSDTPNTKDNVTENISNTSKNRQSFA